MCTSAEVAVVLRPRGDRDSSCAEEAHRSPTLAQRFVARNIVNRMVQHSPARLDASFAALSDQTRRGILERLGHGDASITDLADKFGMTLTGMKKHVSVLEEAGLVATEKVGRVRSCKLGPRRLDDETKWMTKYREMLEERLDHLGKFLERTKGDES